MHTSILHSSKVSILLLISLMLLYQQLFAQDSPPSDSLTQILTAKEKNMFDIITSGDKPAAEKLFSPDYITINADGVMEGREETMNKFGKFKGSTAELSEKKIRTYGNISIITGKAKFYVKSLLVAETFYTETWVWRQGNWDFIGWQGTMTGLPSWYPVIFTTILLLILFFIFRLIRRKRGKSAR